MTRAPVSRGEKGVSSSRVSASTREMALAPSSSGTASPEIGRPVRKDATADTCGTITLALAFVLADAAPELASAGVRPSAPAAPPAASPCVGARGLAGVGKAKACAECAPEPAPGRGLPVPAG